MIVDRYLIREVARPLLVSCLVLMVIFVSYSMARYLTQAADGFIPIQVVLWLVLLKTLIALEVLLPISLYLSVVVGLGCLYSDHEMTALNATGLSEVRVAQAILRFALVIAAIVACLSLYGRPWAYGESYRLEFEAEAGFDLNKLKAGRFYEGTLAGRTLFAERIDHERQRMQQVFIKNELKRRARIIVAEEAYQTAIGETGAPVLKFLRGHIYEIDRYGDRDHIIRFNEMVLHVDGGEADPLGYKRKAASTSHLAQSDRHKDIAELQWRLSTPIVTVLLALLGIPISRTSPRAGKYAKLIVAVLIYAVYYNLSAMAKTWLEEDVVGAFPGIWWTVMLLVALLVILMYQPVWKFWFKRGPKQAGTR